MLHVEIRLNYDVDATVRPDLTSWVEGDRTPWRIVGGAGSRLQRSWDIRVNQEGVWGFALTDQARPSEGRAVYGYSTETDGAISSSKDARTWFPAPQFESSIEVWQDDTGIKAAYSFTPVSPYLRHGNITLRHGADGDRVTAGYGEMTRFVVSLDLAPNARTHVQFYSHWAVDIEDVPGLKDLGLAIEQACTVVDTTNGAFVGHDRAYACPSAVAVGTPGFVWVVAVGSIGFALFIFAGRWRG